jgi:fructose-1,6-bisphosphatase I
MAQAYGDGGPTEKINTEIVTLSRYLSEEQTKHKEATGDFTYVASGFEIIFNH